MFEPLPDRDDIQIRPPVLWKGQTLPVPTDPLLTRLATAWCGRALAGVIEFNL